MDKKGVSPLIATLLLMTFAIALGIVVMSWGRSYIEAKAEFVEGTEISGCGNVQLKLITVGGEVKACYNEAEHILEILLENGPEIDIQNFNALVVGTQSVQTVENILSKPLKRTHALKKAIPYDENVGNVVKLELKPFINVDGIILYCDESSIAVEGQLHPC